MGHFLKNNRGEAYVSAVIFLMIATFCLVFVLQCVGAAVLKISLDNECRQMVKVVQLTGQYTYETQTLVDDDGNSADKKIVTGDLASHFQEERTDRYCIYIDRLGSSEDNNCHIDATTDIIQVGEAFDVTCAEVYRIGFEHLGIDVTIWASRTGVSEKYWKADEFTSD